MTSIHEIKPGDYVKNLAGQWLEVAEVYGIENGRLRKPSEGGFGVVTTGGERIGMFEARAYCKRLDREAS